MIDFSKIIPTAQDVVEKAFGGVAPKTATLIRDLKGKVALFFEFEVEPDPMIEIKLKADLDAALRSFWSGRLWMEGPKASELVKSFGVTVRRERQVLTAPAGARIVSWYLIDRTYSKRGWIDHHKPPWPLVKDKSPAIVSFYSFKGGVGRSTALAAASMILASAGKKVVVVDLDIEAPGVFTLLDPNATIDEGIVDYLVHKSAGDDAYRLELCARLINDPAVIGETGQPLVVLPAGRIDSGYIDKIARIDLNGDDTTANIESLLKDVKKTYSPDFIFLDVRAGLHDIGGLSLNSLSHINLLFCLNTPQSWSGLHPVLEILARVKDREILLVHAMATPVRLDPRAHERFRSKAYDAFKERYFETDDDMPDIDDDSAPYGIPLYMQDSLMNVPSITAPALRTSLLDAGSPYRMLVEKIGERLERSTV